MPFDLRAETWVEGGDTPDAARLDAYPDTQRFLQQLDALDAPASAAPAADRDAARGLFRWADELFVVRAPGRLDVMGGIADYSGSLVLQLPLAEACHVALQRRPVADGERARVRVVSFATDAADRAPAFEVGLEQLLPGGQPIGYDEARALLRRDPATSWAAYVVGALVVLAREAGARFADSLSILVSSEVPEGKGVSSSAAVEVASMAALAAAHGLRLGGRQLALLCQRVENSVVGAPCGVMDQMASALGEASRLLALRCQPAEVQGCAAIPPHLQFWGVDSGKAHSVGGSDYGRVRVGAFMGLRIASELAHAAAGGAAEAAPIGGGYLANVPPSTFAWRYEAGLPEEVQGCAFQQRYGSHWDAATNVDPTQTYAVRTPAGHPVHENFRVHAFRQVLAAPADAAQLQALGELMRQSHVSYSRCGLGAGAASGPGGRTALPHRAAWRAIDARPGTAPSAAPRPADGTDRLVDLTQEEHDAAAARGEAPAVFGAKITGGGSGGTVCILAVAGPRGDEAVQRIVQRYTQEMRYSPKVFRGSSNGAAQFGHLRLLRN